MDKIEVQLVGCGSGISAILVEATRNAFSGSVITAAKNMTEALGRKPALGQEVIVLGRPDPDEVIKAVEAVDAFGLPRWAIVLLGANPVINWVETLSPEELTGPTVPHVLRSAVAQHALKREVARADGYLLAIGSRVCHDLRAEVAGVLTSTELLREILSKEKAALGSLTEPIFDSVDALGRIIERLSFIATVSVRGVAKKQFDMGHAVLRSLQRMDSEIHKKGASMVQPNFWPKVNGEVACIEKVWCDLLANALSYARDQPRIELGWIRSQSEHRFWITDDGVGVPPESRSQLFQPFHLLHRMNSPRGLGLPIVQRLVELQGGNCGYESLGDGGSTFFFTLPT
jgi:light-regulated signal transduction histidine kinase (bacteriophytochrome)